MGWDAWAILDGKEVGTSIEFKPVFIIADEKLQKCSGWRGGLESGSLDGYTSKILLEKATGQSCDLKLSETEFPEWDAQTVQEFYQIANWHMTFEDIPEEAFRYPGDPWMGYWKARIFLETCAINQLGIRFSG